jgi:hypothetical protein
VGGVTTAYVGGHFEWTGSVSTMKRYYSAGGARVAVRTGASTLNYLLLDHLGSTAVTTDLSGVRTSEVRYMPWGAERYTYGTTPTNVRYTGQLNGRLGGERTIPVYFVNCPSLIWLTSSTLSTQRPTNHARIAP